MRTIKFRGKSLTTGEWLYGSHFNDGAEDYILPNLPSGAVDYEDYQVDQNTVGQFTGLCDKLGKEIYEGDILKVYYSGKSMVFGVVRFDEARFYIDDEFMRNELKVKAPMTEIFSYYQFEIIGNVHDNPDYKNKLQICDYEYKKDNAN